LEEGWFQREPTFAMAQANEKLVDTRPWVLQVGDVNALKAKFVENRQAAVDTRSRKDTMRGSLGTVREGVQRATRCESSLVTL